MKPIWKAPMVVTGENPAMTGLVFRSEAFLRDLVDGNPNSQPRAKLKDLEGYIKSLPKQGSYFAEAIHALVEPPAFLPTVQVHAYDRRKGIVDSNGDVDALEAEDVQEWLHEWRNKVGPVTAEFWELIAEAIRANQNS